MPNLEISKLEKLGIFFLASAGLWKVMLLVMASRYLDAFLSSLVILFFVWTWTTPGEKIDKAMYRWFLPTHRS